MTVPSRGAVQVAGEVLSAKRTGAYHHLTLVVPGVAERFRPGTFLVLTIGGELSSAMLRRSILIHRVRATGTYGGTVEVVFAATDRGTRWLSRLRPGDPADVVGPLGRPFTLPREPVPCTLVGGGVGSAPLFSLAERLRGRGCAVHMVLSAPTGNRLFGALEAKRASQSVVISTTDGSAGVQSSVADVLPGVLSRTKTDVVYAAGPMQVLNAAAEAAQAHGAWSQVAVEQPMPCGIGVCLGCVLPVVGEDGATAMVRTCVEGPVLRGDRVRWADIGNHAGDVSLTTS